MCVLTSGFRRTPHPSAGKVAGDFSSGLSVNIWRVYGLVHITITSHKRHGISNHWQLDWLQNTLSRLPTKETPKLHITCPNEEINLSPLDFPPKGPAMWKVLWYYEKNPNGKWPGYIKVHDRRYKCLAQLKSLEEFRISWIVIYRFVNKRKKSYIYTGIDIYIYIFLSFPKILKRVMCFHNFLQINSLNDGTYSISQQLKHIYIYRDILTTELLHDNNNYSSTGKVQISRGDSNKVCSYISVEPDMLKMRPMQGCLIPVVELFNPLLANFFQREHIFTLLWPSSTLTWHG